MRPVNQHQGLSLVVATTLAIAACATTTNTATTSPPATGQITTAASTTLTTTPPTSTNSAPPPAPSNETFISTTSLGPIEWIKVESAGPIYPQSGLNGEFLGVDWEAGAWWTSSDGLTWTATEPPESDPRTAAEIKGETWATESPDGHGTMMGPISHRQVFAKTWFEGGDAALYHRDPTDWVEVPLPSRQPSAGLETHGPEFRAMVALDPNTWVMPMIHSMTVPWGEIYGKFPFSGFAPDSETETLVDPWPIWNEGSQSLEIFAPGTYPGVPLARVSVDLQAGEPAMIAFRDTSTGQMIHEVPATVPGWSSEALLTALRGWGFDDLSFVVNQGGDIRVVRPPWTMGEEWTEETFVNFGDALYTISHPLGENYSATAINLWRSEDGLNWSQLDLPQLYAGNLEYASLVAGTDQIMMRVQASGGEVLWTSTDGVSWQPVDVDVIDHSRIFELQSTDFGWIMGGYTTAAISADGTNWEAFDLPIGGDPTLQYLGGTFFLGPVQGLDHYVLWVGKLVD